MPIFGTSQSVNPSLPINQIKTMRAKGMDNNTIISTLQKEGFSVSNIFDAMNQIDMPGSQPPPAPTPSKSDTDPQSPVQNSNFSQNQQDFYDKDNPSTEELVEAIIDEKWSELEDNISKVIEWKNTTNEKIIALEHKFGDVKKEFDKVHKALLSKLEKYDDSVGNVNANVSAMEKTFSKMLPLFSENISELAKVVAELKEIKK